MSSRNAPPQKEERCVTTQRTALEQTSLSLVVHQFFFKRGSWIRNENISVKSLTLGKWQRYTPSLYRKRFPGFRIPHANLFWFQNSDSLTWGDCYPQFYSELFPLLDYHIRPTHDMALLLKPFAKCLLFVFVNYIVFFYFFSNRSWRNVSARRQNDSP